MTQLPKVEFAHWPTTGSVAMGMQSVIVEVPLEGGLDVLAAFSDGGVRYMNQTGKLAIFEGVPSLQPAVANLYKESQAIVSRIGPWNKERLSPPSKGNIRLSFLV